MLHLTVGSCQYVSRNIPWLGIRTETCDLSSSDMLGFSLKVFLSMLQEADQGSRTADCNMNNWLLGK